MNFTQFNKNGGVEGFCLIKTVDRKMTAKGVPYLDLTLADPDGEINAKLWDYKEELHGEFSANDLIKVRGTVQPFNDSQQLRIERIRKVTEADGVRIEDFVPSAGFSGEAMFDELMKAAESFKDSELKALVTELLNEYKRKAALLAGCVQTAPCYTRRAALSHALYPAYGSGRGGHISVYRQGFALCGRHSSRHRKDRGI